MNRPKVIFFDWNGTLSDSFFWEHMRSSKEEDINTLYNKWDKAMFSETKEMINNWMRGNQTTEEVMKYVSDQTNTEYKVILKEFIKGCKSMSLSSNDLPKILKNLKIKKVKLVIATNNMDCFSRWTVPHMKLNLLFDEIINSYYQKGLKHDRDENGESIFFKNFFKKNNVNTKDCIFIDDSNDKEEFISRLGITYIKINNSSEIPKILNSYL
ncbi:HAD hydrolase-like protein [Candidatus Dojkabacteria bacterium]|jgi:FMN phosphatase YigB (HAD superfamily)|nr:HAD hydrolase-like protein [Candidatus Dojkabacteria bacterium]